MKRLILLLFSGMAFAQTFTVSGHVVNPNTGVPTGAQITFKLINTGTQQCKVSGTGLIVPNNQVFTPDGTGTISGTLYRNDFIVCGGVSNTQWSYVITAPGVTMPTCALAAVVTTSLNVDSAACTNTVPVVSPPTGDTTYCRLDGSNCGFTGNVTFNSHNISGINNGTITGALTAGSLNKVIYVDQQAGATADVKFANACTALPAGGGVLDARGFGPGNQSIAATVSCGSATQPVTFWFDPSTNFQPSTASLNMFQYGPKNRWWGLHIDTTNQATYSGNPIQQTPGVSMTGISLDRISINMASGSTGPCFAFNDSGTANVVFSQFDITCNPGTAASAALISSGGTTFFNGNFLRLNVNGNTVGPKYCLNLLVTASGGGISSNKFEVHCEMATLSTGLAGVHMNSVAAGNSLANNRIELDAFDLQGANQAVIIDGPSSNICGNYFIGLLGNSTATAITDGTGCRNEYFDLLYRNHVITGDGIFSFFGADGPTNGKWNISEAGNSVNMSVYGRTLIAGGRVDLNTYLAAASNIHFQVNTASSLKEAFVDTTAGFVTPSYLQWNESATPGTGLNQDACYGDSTLHHTKCNFNQGNGNAYFPVGLTGNTGGTHSDSGFYQTATAAGCTTAASIGGVCASPFTVTWPVAFQDTNYKMSCSPNGAATNLPSTPYIVTKSAGSVTMNYFAITAAAASWPNVECTAVHN